MALVIKQMPQNNKYLLTVLFSMPKGRDYRRHTQPTDQLPKRRKAISLKGKRVEVQRGKQRRAERKQKRKVQEHEKARISIEAFNRLVERYRKEKKVDAATAREMVLEEYDVEF